MWIDYFQANSFGKVARELEEVDMNCGGSGKRKNNFCGRAANRILTMPRWR